MAKIEIKQATVERLITNKGFAASTTYKDRNGELRKEKYTVWIDNSDFMVGDLLNVNGLFSVRVKEFEGDNGTVRYAEVHVNNPTVSKVNQDGPIKTVDEFESSPF